MAIDPHHVAAIGAGRMGRGIALAFAFAGFPVSLIDIKERSAAEDEHLAVAARKEIHQGLAFMAEAGLLDLREIDPAIGRLRVVHAAEAADAVAESDVIFECVPELIEVKRSCFSFLSAHANRDCLIASTTSTIGADDLAALILRPERFCNAHWLNPAHLMPLVELSPSASTAPETILSLRRLLSAMGKIPVECRSSPGYIVPRIQALAMNEAARLVEEGVATVEDIDTATRVGFGLRFAVLGLLEFIDWGGVDILYRANGFLAETIDATRFASPKIVEENMHQHRRGLRDGIGFRDFNDVDRDAYVRNRLLTFVSLLKLLELTPRPLTDVMAKR